MQERPEAKVRREALVDWLLLPEAERSPRTRTAFAEAWGVSLETIRQDVMDPRVQGELLRRGRQLQRADRTMDVVNALYHRATDEDIAPAAANSAAKIWLDWVDKSDTSTVDTADLTDEELVESIGRLLEAVNARKL